MEKESENLIRDRKYELTDEAMEMDGHTLHRIRALRDIQNIVSSGDVGGWIESEDNLSQIGDCWVYGNAVVSGNARVFDDARVFGNAFVTDNAHVYGNAEIFGDARVSDNAKVYGNAKVSESIRVSDDAQFSGDIGISGNAKVSGDMDTIELFCGMGDNVMKLKFDKKD